MRYRFDADGVSMRWGVLFRREIMLSYARMQDIHLSSNVVERWLGLARIEIQTASGSAKAEMTIEGVMEFEAVRDFLYTRMRGFQSNTKPVKDSTGLTGGTSLPMSGEALREISEALRELAGELKSVREALVVLVPRVNESPAAPSATPESAESPKTRIAEKRSAP
jgi:putative membrane protein